MVKLKKIPALKFLPEITYSFNLTQFLVSSFFFFYLLFKISPKKTGWEIHFETYFWSDISLNDRRIEYDL